MMAIWAAPALSPAAYCHLNQPGMGEKLPKHKLIAIYQSGHYDMKEHTTLSLRLRPAEREALDALKSYLSEPVATKALLHVIRLYPPQHQALQAALDEMEQAKADRDRLLQAVAAAEQGRAVLIDTAAEDCRKIDGKWPYEHGKLIIVVGCWRNWT